MEPRGRNRWQPLVKRPCPKPQQQAKTVAVGCDQLPRAAHDKEGVDGSSPSEGLHASPANGPMVLPAMARFRRFAGTRRVHFGTGGHSRACATSRDTARGLLETVDRDYVSCVVRLSGDGLGTPLLT